MPEPAEPRTARRSPAAVLGLVKQRPELVVLLGMLVSTQLLGGNRVVGGIYGLGVAVGAALALQAIGIVLVFRANRIINFAQVELGALGGALFYQLVANRVLIRGLRIVCPPCVPDATFGRLSQVEAGSGVPLTGGFAVPPQLRDIPIADIPAIRSILPEGIDFNDLAVAAAPGWMVQINFWLAIVLALGAVLALSYGLYSLVMRRFERAPRLVATVATIGLGQVFLLVSTSLVGVGGPGGDDSSGSIVFTPRFPFDWTLSLSPATFRTADILSVVIAVAALAGLAVFFARSSIGVVLRGASENPARASSLGVDTSSLNAFVWMLAGGLSGIASILSTAGAVGGGSNAVKYFTAAVFGGLVSIPITVVAAFAVGILDQAISWARPTPGIIDGVLLVVLVAVQLLQRVRAGRSDTEAVGWNAAREARPIPDELKDLEVVRKWVRIAQVTGLTVALALPWVLSPAQTNLAAVTVAYGIIGVSLLVLTGWAGQISLGHFAFAAIGSYVTALVRWPFPLGLLAGGLAGAAVAVLIGRAALRLRGLQLAVSTLAFAVAVTSILLNPRFLGKALPDSLDRPSIIGLDLDDQRPFYYFALVFLVLATAVVVGLRRSRTARALIAARENEPAAQSFGINLLRARLGAFAVSGFLAAVAGGLFAYSQNGINLSSYGADQSIKMFLMVVIGGLGSVAGPLIGAVYIGFADIFAKDLPLFSTGATGLLSIVLLLFAPGGLGDVAFRIRDAMLRRVADRYRIDVPSLVADRAERGSRAGIAPKIRPGGGTVFIPRRYSAVGQWSVEREKELATRD